jgi:hypothetical protein
MYSMRLISKAILAGCGTVVLAGSAFAAERSLHPTRVAAPDGTVVQVRYSGDSQPRMTLVPVQVAATPEAADPFADMDRMMAAMDAQMAAMMRAASTMPVVPTNADGKPDLAALQTQAQSTPGGVVSYSYYSSSTGANGCTQTVQMSSTGNGAEPKIVRTSAGNCDSAKANTPTNTLPVKAEAPARKEPAPDRRNTI